ncbi:MAG: prolyl oligopeptidase family serine peptidase [Planctomycetaceae bacterium]
MRFAVVTALLFSSIIGAARADDAAPRQVEKKLEYSIPVELAYLLYLPPNYEEQEKWPLLVFLHGSGERGNNLQKVKVHGPPKLVEQGRDFPMIIVSPQCPADKWWDVRELTALIDAVSTEQKVDPDRIYVTGLSMGGYGTWELASAIPDRLAAIVPICGGGTPYRTRRFAKLPVWAFHGAKDSAVPLKATEDMIAALRQNGGDPKLTVYPEANHDSWTETYNNPELYTWLLEQKRGGE